MTDNIEPYKDPEDVRGGRRLPSTRPAMKGHVPVRFSEELIGQVKILAQQDGMTVSTWIRRLVVREVEQRSLPRTGVIYRAEWIRGIPQSDAKTEAGDLAQVVNG
jgi:antitoxin component of RelBE/YafQ-DinJ toxin-antitoxin module